MAKTRKSKEKNQKDRETTRNSAGLSPRMIGVVFAGILIIIAAVLAAPSLSTFFVPSPETIAGGDGTVTVYFFYGEECPHCHEVRPFIESLIEKYPDVELRSLEVWHNRENYQLLVNLNNKIGSAETSVPQVIVGDTILTGSRDIPAGLEQAIIDQKKNLTRNILSSAVLATGPDVIIAPPQVNAIYFYGDTCSHCEKLKPLLADLEARYPGLNLTRLEVYTNAENREYLSAMSRVYGLQNPGVPIIFIGNQVLIGDFEITGHFEAEIRAEQERLASCNETVQPAVTPGNPECPPGQTVLSLPLVVGAALVDSTNPCGLSVLVFLLITMAAAGSRKRILMAGGAYIAAMFLFHLLVGIGLFSVFSISGLSKLFSIVGGVIALLLGIITLTDVVRNRETFLLSISDSHKGMLGDYARMASLPAAFVLGILAGILGFSCTGGIYISILGLMGRDMTVMTGLPWLVLYNVIYILPLVLVTLLVAYGVSPERADQLRTRHKRALRVIIGVILVALGAIILLGWVG